MKIIGILLVVLSLGLMFAAWTIPLPGGRTKEQVMENGVWKTVKDIDHTRPTRLTLAGTASVVFVLGVGVTAFAWWKVAAKRKPREVADDD